MTILYISLGAIAVALIVYIVMHIHQQKMSKEVQEKTEKSLKTYGEVTKEHHHTFLTIDDVTYQIVYVHVSSSAELTINSTTIWEVREYGKSRLIHQGHLMTSKTPKIVVVYPLTQVIKRYINENEMEFVKYNKMFYNMYVVRHFELDSLLEELTHA